MVEISFFLIGLIFGSFANMLIHRLPNNISCFNPTRSICPNCKSTISWYENIPLLSYIWLKATCSKCKKSISISYFLVELLCGLVFVFLYIKLGLTFEFLSFVVLFWLLIILSVIDINHKAVPDYLLIVVLIVAFFLPNFYYVEALSFAGGGFLLEIFVTFYIQNIKYKITKNSELKSAKAMGEGDIPVFAIIGGVLGVGLGIVAITIGTLVALIPSIVGTLKNQPQIPFIPYLSLGLFLTYMWNGLL